MIKNLLGSDTVDSIMSDVQDKIERLDALAAAKAEETIKYERLASAADAESTRANNTAAKLRNFFA